MRVFGFLMLIFAAMLLMMKSASAAFSNASNVGDGLPYYTDYNIADSGDEGKASGIFQYDFDAFDGSLTYEFSNPFAGANAAFELPEFNIENPFAGALSAFQIQETITHMPNNPNTEAQQQANLAAFIMTIRTVEGTADADGYRRMFGGKLFDSFADHPREIQTATFGNGLTVRSAAAGIGQFMPATWDSVVNNIAMWGYKLPDFSPASQDEAMIRLLKYRKAYDDVLAGNFASASHKVRNEWASFPGNTYGQPSAKLSQLETIYQSNGGVIA